MSDDKPIEPTAPTPQQPADTPEPHAETETKEAGAESPGDAADGPAPDAEQPREAEPALDAESATDLPEHGDEPATVEVEAAPASSTGEDASPSPGSSGEAPATEEGSTAPSDGAEAEGGAEAKPKPVRRRPKDPAVARAHRLGMPMEGRVEAVIKGGYEVRLGKSRAFCPHSQIDTLRVDEPEAMVGKSFDFRVVQYRRGGEDVVVSRRALLEAERAEEAAAVRATLIEGAIMQGKVAGLAPFGAFVDLGAGVQGLVHVSELSHRRVTKVEEAVTVGDIVKVKVLKIEKDGQRISLSARRAERDPWSGVGERFEVGQSYPGKVVRLADFGAFVEMEPGVEALAPAREFPPAGSDWTADVQPGTERRWRVLSVERKRRRMSVVPEVEGAPSAPIELVAGTVVDGRVQKIERFGVFVWIAPGQVGLMPIPLAGIQPGSRLDATYAVGSPVRVRIVDVEEGGRRIRLAAEGVSEETIAADRERGSAPRDAGPRRPGRRREQGERGPKETMSQEPDSTFGASLGDALRAALDRGKKG